MSFSMRPWLAKTLLAAAGVVFALVLCEVGLRLAGIEYPNFYAFDAVLGSSLRPGIKGYWLREGGGYVSINGDGWRDREHAVQKPPNTIRIAVLGDSFAEALQVNQDEAFWAVLEKELQGCGNLRGQHVEVLNFGVSGYGTTQELLTLKHRVWKYAPDLVLLAFSSGNDVADNSPILNQRSADPFYVFRDGQLVLDDSRTKRLAATLGYYEDTRNWLGHLIVRFDTLRDDHLRTYQVLHRFFGIMRDRWSPQKPLEIPGTVRHAALGGGMFLEIYQEPADDIWKEAWQVTEALLIKMAAEVAAKGARFYVVVLSNDVQVQPDEAERRKLASLPGFEEVFYPDRKLERFCRNRNIPVLLLGPPFQDYSSRRRLYLHGFKDMFRNTLGSGHWNRDGHRLAGELIARWLCPQLP